MAIVLAGNPNCGKTTVFNALTGSAEYTGNRAGVTVDVKLGRLKNSELIIADLPGIYSLSPYSPEEKIARDYLLGGEADAIINVIDAVHPQRSLYLTLQLCELGLPVLICLNMADAAEKKGIKIDAALLSRLLGKETILISATDKNQILSLAEKASSLKKGKIVSPINCFSEKTRISLLEISQIIENNADKELLEFYSAKLFERDEDIFSRLNLSEDQRAAVLRIISERENEENDLSQSIIISERYAFCEKLSLACVKSAPRASASEKADKILTGKFTAIPIFILIMATVYFLSAGVLGGSLGKLLSEGIESFSVYAGEFLRKINCADWLTGLITEGIISGVGSVLAFLPQLAILFALLAVLEDTGYMSRAAFIFDRFFRFFGLSGKCAVPMIIAAGCAVPAVMSSRTIDDPAERGAAVITASFIPCSAKLPVISLIAGSYFAGKWYFALLAYFLGMIAVLLSGWILKLFPSFKKSSCFYLTELPDYHAPRLSNILFVARERIFSFVKRAASVILLASAAVWFLSRFGFDGGFFITNSPEESLLRNIGEIICVFFAPLGFGDWQPAAATIMGLAAKEEIAAAFAVIPYTFKNSACALSFLVFNLLCVPCVSAVWAIKTELGSFKRTLFALIYQTALAYAFAFAIYSLGGNQ